MMNPPLSDLRCHRQTPHISIFLFAKKAVKGHLTLLGKVRCLCKEKFQEKKITWRL